MKGSYETGCVLQKSLSCVAACFKWEKHNLFVMDYLFNWLGKNPVSSCVSGSKPWQAFLSIALAEKKCNFLRQLEKHLEKSITLSKFTTYNIIIRCRSKVIFALVKRASMASYTIPSTMKIIGYKINEICRPTGREQEVNSGTRCFGYIWLHLHTEFVKYMHLSVTHCRFQREKYGSVDLFVG